MKQKLGLEANNCIIYLSSIEYIVSVALAIGMSLERLVANEGTSMEGKLGTLEHHTMQLHVLICHLLWYVGMTPKTRYIDPCLASHIGSCEVRKLTYHHLMCVCLVYFCITNDGKQTMFVMSELHHTEQRYCTPEHWA